MKIVFKTIGVIMVLAAICAGIYIYRLNKALDASIRVRVGSDVAYRMHYKQYWDMDYVVLDLREKVLSDTAALVLLRDVASEVEPMDVSGLVLQRHGDDRMVVEDVYLQYLRYRANIDECGALLPNYVLDMSGKPLYKYVSKDVDSKSLQENATDVLKLWMH
jgi:hypothetical protein